MTGSCVDGSRARRLRGCSWEMGNLVVSNLFPLLPVGIERTRIARLWKCSGVQWCAPLVDGDVDYTLYLMFNKMANSYQGSVKIEFALKPSKNQLLNDNKGGSSVSLISTKGKSTPENDIWLDYTGNIISMTINGKELSNLYFRAARFGRWRTIHNLFVA